MSDPVWRKRVNMSLEKLDELANIVGILAKLVENQGVQIGNLTSQVDDLQGKIKESRKRPKKTRSKQHHIEVARRGKKS